MQIVEYLANLQHAYSKNSSSTFMLLPNIKLWVDHDKDILLLTNLFYHVGDTKLRKNVWSTQNKLTVVDQNWDRFCQTDFICRKNKVVIFYFTYLLSIDYRTLMTSNIMISVLLGNNNDNSSNWTISRIYQTNVSTISTVDIQTKNMRTANLRCRHPWSKTQTCFKCSKACLRSCRSLTPVEDISDYMTSWHNNFIKSFHTHYEKGKHYERYSTFFESDIS